MFPLVNLCFHTPHFFRILFLNIFPENQNQFISPIFPCTKITFNDPRLQNIFPDFCIKNPSCPKFLLFRKLITPGNLILQQHFFDLPLVALPLGLIPATHHPQSDPQPNFPMGSPHFSLSIILHLTLHLLSVPLLPFTAQFGSSGIINY